MDYRLSPWSDGQTYVSPVNCFRQELHDARKVLDKSDSDRVVVYILSTDAVCHILEWQAAKRELLELDRWIERIFFDYRANIHITMFADHGNNFIPSRRIELERGLRAVDPLSL